MTPNRMLLDVMTPNRMLLYVMTPNIMLLDVMTPNRMLLYVMTLNIMLLDVMNPCDYDQVYLKRNQSIGDNNSNRKIQKQNNTSLSCIC
jgi:hypothetical protein